MKPKQLLTLALALLAAALFLILVCPLLNHYILTKNGSSGLVALINVANLVAGIVLILSIVLVPVAIIRVVSASSKKS